MPNWTETNERRIGEKTQELRNYCSQRRDSMTPRAFELARISLANLLDNLMDRNPDYRGIPETVKQSMDNSEIDTVARCSDEQAQSLARTIVYKAVGDDIGLYPVTALQKIQKSRAKGEPVCDIPADEMTARDFLTVAHAIAEGVRMSPKTIQAVISKFREKEFTPLMMRVYGYFAFTTRPFNIRSLPGYSVCSSEYKRSAEKLTELGFFAKNPEGEYQVTDMRLDLE